MSTTARRSWWQRGERYVMQIRSRGNALNPLEKGSLRGMENLESEKLYLHEGHDEDFEDDDGMPMDEEHPMWRSERITLNSVGIDIGSRSEERRVGKEC